MTRYENLMARIASGEKILIDGATGSEMTRRGVPEHENGWSGGAALSHPEILRDVHREYIEMGSNLIISNTFATHMGVLRDAGVQDQFDELNRRSVELAVESRDAGGRPEVVVAAGMSHWSFTGEDPPLDELEHFATEQAVSMMESGAELIMLEMMVDIERMHRLINAAEAAGLPVWVGFTVGSEDGELADPATMSLFTGEQLLADAIDSLKSRKVDLVSVMHTDVDLIDPCLDVVFECWAGPVGVYAHSWRPLDPGNYAARSARWLDRGVSIIGGCCGTLPEHVAALAEIDGIG